MEDQAPGTTVAGLFAGLAVSILMLFISGMVMRTMWGIFMLGWDFAGLTGRALLGLLP